jgi:uracil-DNA glycosylase family 4
MSLLLDERQHAMLREMGVRLFQPPASRIAVAPVSIAEHTHAASTPVHFVNETAAPEAAQAVPAVAGDIGLLEWDALAQTVAECRACTLCNGRRNTVFGVGDRQADWLIVGEAPGENDDLQGEPFMGQAGLLLDNMLRALGLNRKQKVYITNVLKCRPPGNRNPEPQEVAQCEPFLRRQVELLQPRVILAMGRFAVQAMLQSNEPIGKLRGQVHRYNGVPLVVTYHPAYLLRNLADKGKAWADLCLALEVMEQPAQAQGASGR